MDFALDSGNTAWMIVATALVLLMTPALAFFYGGMVRTKSVLNMMMMSFISIGNRGGHLGGLRLRPHLRRRHLGQPHREPGTDSSA